MAAGAGALGRQGDCAPLARVAVASSGAASLARLGAPLVLLRGGDRRGVLRRAGYTVATYRPRWVTADVVVAAPDRRALGLVERTWFPGGSGRRGVRGFAFRMVPSPPITVAARCADAGPAVQRAAGLRSAGTTGSALATDVHDDRRRAVVLVPGVEPGRARAVVKVSRSPHEEDRATHEQHVLSLLPLGDVTPRPLGAGRTRTVAWSPETALTGQPLRVLLTDPDAPVLPVLGRLADWLGDVAVRTATPVDWKGVGDGDRVVALRGPATGLRRLLQGLSDVPAIVTHGDLASGHNVLVDETGRPAVLDWETARERGLPLLDLVPLLCCSLARARAGAELDTQADYVVDLATGRSAESEWLFARVANHAARLRLPPAAIGPLAILAWGHQASMRLVKAELQAAAGLPPARWQSLGELVLRHWEQEVGLGWPGPVRRLK